MTIMYCEKQKTASSTQYGFITSWPCCFDRYRFSAKAEYYGKNNTKYLEYQPLANIPFLHAVTIVEAHYFLVMTLGMESQLMEIGDSDRAPFANFY